MLSQRRYLDEDYVAGSDVFPTGQFDEDRQQVDLRHTNSWRLRLHEVETPELLEVQLINAIAPYILNARLKPLMVRTPGRHKHVVNVSAMEGQFYRKFKTTRHPHTNMAKAALNMMTRTAAADYHADGIHMNAVDTGWVTDEDPHHIAERKQAGSSLKFCLIAEGQADIYPRFGPTNEWDTAAGQGVLEAAGGEVVTTDGRPLAYGKKGFGNPHFIARSKGAR